MERKKVAIITPTLFTGGAENMAIQTAIALDIERFDLEFICLSRCEDTIFEKKLKENNITIKFLDKRLGLDIRTFIKMWKTLSAFKPDIVHTHLGAMFYVFPWILFKRKKFIHTIHSVPKNELPVIQRSILFILYHIGVAIPVAISDEIAKRAADLYLLPIKNIPVIYNPVNINRFNLMDNKPISKEIVFCCVARFTKIKNQQFQIQAFMEVIKEVAEIKLILVGDGELRADVEKMVVENNLSDKIILTGNVPDVENYLCNSDVFILSSIYEGLPLSILEAMAAGLPIISTNVGGVPDIVKDRENGILVPLNDIDSYANAMIEMAKNKELREKMGTMSRKYAQEYDLDLITRKYESLYIDNIK